LFVTSLAYQIRDLLRILSRIRLSDSVGNVPVSADDIRNPLGCTIFFGAASPVGDADFPLSIAQQRIRKRLIVREFLVCCDIISAAAEYLNVLTLKLLDSITESLALSRSATRTGARIKPQHDSLSRIVA
jgi:hypothetical protein